MQAQGTFEKFVEILDEVAGIDPESVRPDQSFLDDLDVDSLTMVEVLVHLDDKFGVKIADDDVPSLRTVGDMVEYLNKAGLSA